MQIVAVGADGEQWHTKAAPSCWCSTGDGWTTSSFRHISPYNGTPTGNTYSYNSGADPGICVGGHLPPSSPPLFFPLSSLLSPPFPFPFSPFLSPPLHSPPILSPSLPSPPVRSRSPVLRLGGLGERSSSPDGSGRSPGAKRFLVNC